MAKRSNTVTMRRPLSRVEIATRIRGMIAEQMTIDPNTFPESAQLLEGAGLAFDSLDLCELAVGIEGSFEIVLPADAMQEPSLTVGQLVDLVEAQYGGIA